MKFLRLLAAGLLLAASLVSAAELQGTQVPVGSEIPQAGQPPVAPDAPLVTEEQNSSVVAVPNPRPQPIQRIIENEIAHEIPSFGYDSDFNEFVLIPIVSVIVVFGGGFAFVIYLVVLRNRAAAQRRLQHQEQIQKFIDAGRDVPDILLRDTEGYSSQTNLAKGVKDTLIGLAIVVFLTVLVGFDIGAAGLIIVAAGLARIIIWKLTQDKNS